MESDEIKYSHRQSRKIPLLLQLLFIPGGCFGFRNNFKRLFGLSVSVAYFSILFLPAFDLISSIEFRNPAVTEGVIYYGEWEDMDSRNEWEYHANRYMFEIDGKEYYGISYSGFELNPFMPVEYLPERPERSRIQGTSTSSFFVHKDSDLPAMIVIIFGGFYFLFGVIIYFALYWNWKWSVYGGRETIQILKYEDSLISDASEDTGNIFKYTSNLISINESNEISPPPLFSAAFSLLFLLIQYVLRFSVLAGIPIFFLLIFSAEAGIPFNFMDPLLKPAETLISKTLRNYPAAAYGSLKNTISEDPPPLEIYRANGRITLLSEGASVNSGDILQPIYNFQYNKYTVLFSVDGSGTVSYLLPQKPVGLAPHLQFGKQNFPFSFRLDEAPDSETFFLFFSDNPFPAALADNILKNYHSDLIKGKYQFFAVKDIEIFRIAFKKGK